MQAPTPLTKGLASNFAECLLDCVGANADLGRKRHQRMIRCQIELLLTLDKHSGKLVAHGNVLLPQFFRWGPGIAEYSLY